MIIQPLPPSPRLEEEFPLTCRLRISVLFLVKQDKGSIMSCPTGRSTIMFCQFIHRHFSRIAYVTFVVFQTA